MITVNASENGKAFQTALKIIKSGGVVVLPTDTVYGLVCDAFNESAVRKVFEIKRRPGEKSLPIFVSDLAMAKKYAVVSDKAAGVLCRFWPGALTVVLLLKKKTFPEKLTGGKNTIALRMPNHDLTLSLIRGVKRPLAQTSANVSGFSAACNAREVKRFFRGSSPAPDLLIDGGSCSGTGSVILDLTCARPKILREGGIPSSELI